MNLKCDASTIAEIERFDWDLFTNRIAFSRNLNVKQNVSQSKEAPLPYFDEFVNEKNHRFCYLLLLCIVGGQISCVELFFCGNMPIVYCDFVAGCIGGELRRAQHLIYDVQ